VVCVLSIPRESLFFGLYFCSAADSITSEVMKKEAVCFSMYSILFADLLTDTPLR
jgi:hypothetical protein